MLDDDQVRAIAEEKAIEICAAVQQRMAAIERERLNGVPRAAIRKELQAVLEPLVDAVAARIAAVEQKISK